MKRNSLTLLLAAAGMLLAGVQTAKAQKQSSTAEGKVKVVLHMADGQTFECSISQLDSITFVGDDLIIEEEHEWVDLGLPSGTLWATCNVGANSPEEYGDYFAWGETEPKDFYDWNTYKWCMGDYNTMTKYCPQSDVGYNGFTDTLTELEPADDAATANWGSGWQMPSMAQCQELINSSYTTTEWTTQNGVNGRKITSNINGKSIFLSAAGFHEGNRHSPGLGICGTYWSRSLCKFDDGEDEDGCTAYSLAFWQNMVFGDSDFLRFYGQSIRPVRVQGNPKIRVGIYETIPGYSVQDLKFYADATTDITQTNCVLFADASDETFTIDFGTLNTYPLGTTSANVTYAGNTDDNYYTSCSPNEEGTDLILRANYTLIASDGSGEVIHVSNASAQVPAEYTKWESGRAYTYIFKIHDNYTGWTAGQSVSELYPIRLDAIVIESDGSQQVITR